MPRHDLTEIICIVDRSGSMAAIREDAQGGFNTFIDDQKKAEGEARITLVQFDHEYEVVWDAKNIKEVPEYMLMPRGSTALLDAIGKTVNAVGHRLAKEPEEKRPGKVVVMILTDGQENSSKEFTRRSQIQDIIKHQEEKYSWLFVYLAANQDAIGEASSLGISGCNAMNFAPTGKGVRAAYRVYSANVTRYRSTGDATSMDMPDNVAEEDLQ